ncbi:MAG: hypothetical protein LM564_02515 [Desulfurococcaceae archaeon]|nr:hypothetical protein [Desulfurococcaceae archaeon]
MRLVLFGECPWVPSSAGKVTYLIARGLTELGHDVLVLCAGTGRPFTGTVCFNPAKWYRGRYARYPDTDIYVAPYRQGFLRRVVEDFYGSTGIDGLIAYGTSFGSPMTEVNADVGRLGVGAVAYTTNDITYLNPSPAASVLAYSAVSAPTGHSLNEYVRSLRVYYENVDEVLDRFSAVHHGIDLEVYQPRTCEKVCRDEQVERFRRGFGYRVVSMVAKNHVRKDYGTLARVVARLVREGYDVAFGFYAVRGVAAPVWDLNSINEQVELVEGVSLLDLGRVATLDAFDDAEGCTEDTVLRLYCCFTDVHAFLTRGESFGLPPVESLALGRPTVSTDIPPQREVLGDTVPLVRAELDLQQHAGLYRVDADDAYAKVKQVLDGGWDFGRAYQHVRRYGYLEMARRLAELARRASGLEPLHRVLRKRRKVLTQNLPGV